MDILGINSAASAAIQKLQDAGVSIEGKTASDAQAILAQAFQDILSIEKPVLDRLDQLLALMKRLDGAKITLTLSE